MSQYKINIFTENALIKQEEEKITHPLKIFQTFDWLSQISDEITATFCYDEDDQIIGYLPLLKTKKHGIKAYHAPVYTPYFGPVVFENDLSKKEKIIHSLLQPFLNEQHLDFMLPLEDQDILPYLKLGFSIEARQNHIFPVTEKYDLQLLNSGKSRDIKRVMKKVDSADIFIIHGKEAIHNIIELQKITGERKGFDGKVYLLSKILLAQNTDKLFCIAIVDKNGSPIAGACCPKDDYRMYHLIGASKRIEDKILNLSNYLVLYLCIRHANENSLTFDFEGSSLPGVASFYRAMGGQPIIKYRLQKTRSLKYSLLRSLQRIKTERN